MTIKRLVLINILTLIILATALIFLAWRVGQYKNKKKPVSSKTSSVKNSTALVKRDMETEGLTKMQIGNQELWVEIASTSAQKAKGLSERKGLRENVGLLFTYEIPQTVAFWMKDMLFPIDIIWITDNQIVGIAENAPTPALGTHDEDLPRYRSPKPVNYVLETNAFWCKKNNIKVGDNAEINLDR